MNPTIPPDPAIDEIRQIRHQISASFDHDPAKLVAHLKKFQEQFQDRLIYDPSGSDELVTQSPKELVTVPTRTFETKE